jgi:hypothetical protein
MKRSLAVIAAVVTVMSVQGLAPAQAAVSQIFLGHSCAGGAATVSISWSGNDPAALQQWVDLSIFDNGWQDGTFLSAGPFAASTTSHEWGGLASATGHFIRVNQQMADGQWDSSQTYYFVTAACAGADATAGTPPPAPPSAFDADAAYRARALTYINVFVAQQNQGWEAARESIRDASRATDVIVLKAEMPGIAASASAFLIVMAGLEPPPSRFAEAHARVVDAARELQQYLSTAGDISGLEDAQVWLRGLPRRVDAFNAAIGYFRNL